jgi:hypothetical protein
MRTRLEVPSTSNPYTPAGSTVTRELARLTPRDLTLLGLLDEHQVFTTHQIAQLGYHTSDWACKRMTVLNRRRVLERFRRWVPAGSAPWHWAIGPVGAAVLSARNGTPLPRPATLRERVDRLAASPKLAHLVGTNGFFVSLSAYAREHAGAALSGWLSERQATTACGEIAHPDGGGVWSDHGRTVPFWLEWDTGTERPLSRVAGKLTGYGHLAGTQAGRLVLFWFPSAVRETHFAAHLARFPVPAGVSVATASAELADACGGPAGPVWSLSGQPGRVRLANLPGGR